MNKVLLVVFVCAFAFQANGLEEENGIEVASDRLFGKTENGLY